MPSTTLTTTSAWRNSTLIGGNVVEEVSALCAAASVTSHSLPCAESRKHFREVFGTDIEVFADPPPQHRGRNVPVVALRLGFTEDMQDHSLLACQSVANVRQCIFRTFHYGCLYTRSAGRRHPGRLRFRRNTCQWKSRSKQVGQPDGEKPGSTAFSGTIARPLPRTRYSPGSLVRFSLASIAASFAARFVSALG